MLFARPLTILFLLPLAEKKWVTPDRITLLAILTKGLGILLIANHPSYGAGLWAAALINLGLVLDNMDGTLARFRQCGTFFGFYFDKISDAITLLLLFWAVGYRAFLVTGNILDLIIPTMGIGGAMVAGYSKWVADRVVRDIELKHRLRDNQQLQQWVSTQTKHDQIIPPPKRTFGDWLRWFGWAFFSILLVNEVDLFFWISLALITGKYWIFTRIISSLLILGLIVGPVVFAVKIRRAERNV